MGKKNSNSSIIPILVVPVLLFSGTLIVSYIQSTFTMNSFLATLCTLIIMLVSFISVIIVCGAE